MNHRLLPNALLARLAGILVLFAPPFSVRAQPPALAAAPGAQVETIVCLRHGEITPVELGQLSVRGLNRSLALPGVLIAKFGRPQFIFAPNPAQQISRGAGPKYCYVRPLATIEPTAIFCGLPVSTLFGFTEIQALQDELARPPYRNAVVFVCWEHYWLNQYVKRQIASLGGDPAQVPHWPGSEFDRICVLKITTRPDGHRSVTFTLDREGLDHLSKRFPQPVSDP